MNKVIAAISKNERAALHRLIIDGQLNAARCVERLMMDGETVLRVTVGGAAAAQIDILPPGLGSPLWHESATARITDEEVTMISTRFGCAIRWTVTRAEAELMRIIQHVKMRGNH